MPFYTADDDPSTFARRLNRRAENVRQNIERVRREVAEEMLIEVVLATPVDTGKARSNWQVGIGAPPSGVVSPYAPGRHLGLGETGNANGAIYAGQSVLRVSDPDQTIYIGNNVHYLEKLNDGFSPQAGAGFVERAFERARQRVNRARRVLDRPGTR